jgi:transposase InsO family protein
VQVEALACEPPATHGAPLLAAQARLRRDGRGRVFDNIFVERLWRRVKYEEVYLKDYPDVVPARHELGRYFTLFHTERFHQALEYRTPESVHSGAGAQSKSRVGDRRGRELRLTARPLLDLPR